MRELLKQLELGGDEGERALSALGLTQLNFEQSESWDLFKATVDREISLVIDQATLKGGIEEMALNFAHIKGMRTIVNRLKWYREAAEDLAARKYNEEVVSKEDIDNESTFIGGLEAGPDSGVNSIV